jgi:hypothetical protein
MKGSERHRLKDNELANLAQSVTRAVESRQREVMAIAVAVIVVVAAIAGYVAWQSRVESRAAGALAAAAATLDTPAGPDDPQNPIQGPRFATEKERNEEALRRFKAVADEHPSTDAGRLARYREASLLLALERPAEALAAFRQVVDAAGSEVLGQMARLGLAEAHAQAGEYDQAIAAYQELAGSVSGPVPVEGVLMQLARAQKSAGRTEDAKQTLTRVVEEFSSSPYGPEAQRELELLNES